MSLETEQETKYREVLLSGILYVGTQKYFLLHPKPIEPDTWQNDNAKRFLVAPTHRIDFTGDNQPIYGYPRHIVATMPYLIEYIYVKDTINVVDLEDYSVETDEIPISGSALETLALSPQDEAWWKSTIGEKENG